MKKLSVVVPVYNVEKYISGCINSLLSQTYENLEIVLVNDCSTDKSLEILLDYGKRYSKKITVIDSKVNMRQGGARNLGMKASDSEYIGFVDPDDYISPYMYEVLMKEVERTSADAAFIRTQKVDEDSEFSEQVFSKNSEISGQILDDNGISQMIISHKYDGIMCGVYKRSVIFENDLLFPEHIAYEDNFWKYAFCMQMKSASVIPLELYYYRQQPNSTMHQRNAAYQYDRIHIMFKLFQYAKENKVPEFWNSLLEYLEIEVLVYNSFQGLIELMDQPSSEELSNAKNFLKNNYPHWNKNIYYRENFTFFKKINMKLLMLFPTSIYISLRQHLKTGGKS